MPKGAVSLPILMEKYIRNDFLEFSWNIGSNLTGNCTRWHRLPSKDQQGEATMICPECGIEIHGSFEIHGYCHNCGHDLVPPSRPLSHPPDAFATNDDFLEQFVNMAGAKGYFA
ncbi:hypothetical protein GF325_17930, partial [Candidatus Bathyarchaeota archaeon]|nr:hypothetical protein [Candidatus Bathyarchaeota archaeon]